MNRGHLGLWQQDKANRKMNRDTQMPELRRAIETLTGTLVKTLAILFACQSPLGPMSGTLARATL